MVMIASYSTGVNRPRAASTTSVVGPFDPPEDRDPQLLTSVPGMAVQDVLLEQGEEALHGRVVAGGTDSAHGSDHAVAVQCVDELPASKLRSPVRVDHAAGDVTAPGHGVVERCDGQPRLHPRRHREAIRAKSGFAGLFSLWFPLLTTSVAAWFILYFVPTLFGAPLSTLRLFQPDFGLVLVATAVTGVLWAVFRLVVAYTGRSGTASAREPVQVAEAT